MSDTLQIDGERFQDKPHGWIQWKGTDVCIDLHCACGALIHFDGDFLYYFICPHCGRMWEVGSHVALYEVPESEHEDVKDHCVQYPEKQEEI